MNNKKLGSALAVAVLAAVGVYLLVNRTADTDVPQDPSAPAAETNSADMIREPAPQVATDRFEPLPSVGTGQYTEPEHRKPAAKEQ